jgi:pimeloyl-ACP methyl ester carboxylesterase
VQTPSGVDIVLDALRSPVGHAFHVPPIEHWADPHGKIPRSYVYLHGLASVRAGQKSDAVARLAASEGASFTRFDFRGHGDSAGTMWDLTISGMIEDTVTVLEHASKSHSLGVQGCPSHILVGSSMGGLVAAWTAVEARHLVEALVLLAPGLNLCEQWQMYRLGDEETEQALRIKSSYCDNIDLGPSMLADYANYDEGKLAAELTRLRVPVLLVHGESDDAIPIMDAANFYLNIQHKEKDFWQVPTDEGGDHRLNKPMPEICTRISAFLDKQNL